jgi:putative transposase
MLDKSAITTKRSCELVGLSRTGWYRPPQESKQNQAIRKRMRQLASERPVFGSPRLTILLQREFGAVNHKRIELLYAEEGLHLPRRPKRCRRGISRPVPRVEPTTPCQRASMDFVHDVLADGRRIRVLTLVDAMQHAKQAPPSAQADQRRRVLWVDDRPNNNIHERSVVPAL